jgi:Domain of unknown function (DUF4864)
MSGSELGLAFVGFAAAFGAVRPSGLDDTQKEAIQDVIQRQIDAFRAGDAALAFSFAAAPTRRAIGSAERFFHTVWERYRPAHSPTLVEFVGLKMTQFGLTQAVRLTDEKGEKITALYIMGRDHGGPWKIGAVHIPYPVG